MLSLEQTEAGVEFRIKEFCGLAHACQAIELDAPGLLGEGVVLRARVTGTRYPVQLSRSRPGHVFVLLGLAPYQELQLIPDTGAVLLPHGGARVVEGPDTKTLCNGRMSIKVECAEDAVIHRRFPAGPIRQFRRDGYPWRGATHFDVPSRPQALTVGVEESGPVRVAVLWRLTFEDGRWYELRITLDAGASFARCEERFDGGPGAQLVWDFHGASLPVRARLLDATESCRPVLPNPHIDNRIARLAAWTQGSQLFDFSDGFGLLFADGDEAGFVTLGGGDWRGSQLNHMELWMRRWKGGDPATRRGLPPEAKADSSPSPEAIPARGPEVCVPHLNVEGWLMGGRRCFALACADASCWGYVSEEAMRGVADPFARVLDNGRSHFMSEPAELAGSCGQYHLRRLHIQQGMMPLQAMLSQTCEWPTEPCREPSFGWPHPSIAGHHGSTVSGDDRADADAMIAYLKTRVWGFWKTSGAGASNPVSGRRIAPELFRFESLCRARVLSDAEVTNCRAWFAFLAYLYGSDHYYPAAPPMLPASDPDSFEPTVAGMCNQNFHTDAANVAGVAAQVFPGHPAAGAWREHFGRLFRRQLAYHVYPGSGVWEESHTYYNHVLHTVFPVLARRRADGVDDCFADPAFQAFVGCVLTQVTPRDAMFGGHRHLLPLGDHTPERAAPWRFREMYAHYAAMLETASPGLAAQLAWLSRECGAAASGVAPEPPEWRSAYVQGLGYFFRARDAAGEEELLAFRCGSAWGHHHADDGSLQFYARGRAWLADAGCGHATRVPADKFEARGHSRWEPRGITTQGFLWRFNRGWIESHGAGAGGLEWAVGWAPVAMAGTQGRDVMPLRSLIAHRRVVIKLMSCAYLVIDTTTLPESHVVRYHVPRRGAERSVTGNRVTVRQQDSALDVAVLPFAGDSLTTWDSEPAEAAVAEAFATACLEFDGGMGCLAVSAFGVRTADATPLTLDRTAKGVAVAWAGRQWAVDLSDPCHAVVRCGWEQIIALTAPSPRA